MEIVKQNETFSLADTTADGWVMTGTANKTVGGDLSLNFGVSKPGELMEEIGNFSYTKPTGNSMVNINCSVTEPNRDKFMAYADTVIDTVIAHFNK